MMHPFDNTSPIHVSEAEPSLPRSRSPRLRVRWPVLCGLLVLLVIAAGTFVLLPRGSAQAVNAAVAYADSHWNCATAACTSRVSAGSPQPSFQCAEFVARALAAEGLVP